MVATAHDEDAPLLGRLEEQTLLTSLLDEVATRGQALVLHGEPGIGKSRLLSETARAARERGMAVLTTTGVQSEAHLPFAGLHQLLRPVRERASELPDVQRAALDAAFGLTHEAAPEHFRIAMAALDLVSDVATDAPLLLVVDDAHWLDRPTADVLAFVARRIESDPIVVLAAIRDGYSSVLGEAGCRSTRLAAPRRCDGRRAARRVGSRASRAAARAAILREAAGNPLALLELPAAAAGRGRAVGAGRPAVDRAARARVRRPRGGSARGDSPRPAGRRAQRRATPSARSSGGTRDRRRPPWISMSAAPAAEAGIVDADLQTIRFRHPLIRSAHRAERRPGGTPARPRGARRPAP